MPSLAEVKAFLENGPPLSATAAEKLLADYRNGSSTVERIVRLEMRYLPLVRKKGRAI